MAGYGSDSSSAHVAFVIMMTSSQACLNAHLICDTDPFATNKGALESPLPGCTTTVSTGITQQKYACSVASLSNALCLQWVQAHRRFMRLCMDGCMYVRTSIPSCFPSFIHLLICSLAHSCIYPSQHSSIHFNALRVSWDQQNLTSKAHLSKAQVKQPPS